jgi:molybdate transport system ATP-binding protein
MNQHAETPSDEPVPGEPLIIIERATAVRPGGERVFRDLDWTVRAGETWAVVGPVGSGKTSLAELILGRYHLEAGAIAYPFLDRLAAGSRPAPWPADVIRHVSFKEDSWQFSYARHYYQQRFSFIEAPDDLALDAFLRSGTAAADAEVAAVAGRLGIRDLLPLSLIKLSSGQIRRARIARALLARPELLILDEPFLGLDVAGRAEVAAILGDLVAAGLRVLLITRPGDVPGWVTHVLELDHRAVRSRGMRAEFLTRQPAEVEPSPQSPPPATTAEVVIELRNVNVAYGDRRVLRDVSWTVRAGERWAVLGPNGAGKSTLLSLICADHPQAYSNELFLFGQRRGTGESIWDIKRRIGLVSPELHLYFSEPLTAARTAATGFFDVVAARPTTPAQDARVGALFAEFGIAGLAERPFARLSTGEQRLVLLIRALVKDPPVLILDEPFQALDADMIGRARDFFDTRLRLDQTLLVTHYAREIPRTVNRRLRLEEGRVVEMT